MIQDISYGQRSENFTMWITATDLQMSVMTKTIHRNGKSDVVYIWVISVDIEKKQQSIKF